jgi:5-methyltetrahydropteroyltriglutamate--homocysteine methyltransferase
MIESSISGILPRPSRLISKTRQSARSRISDEELAEAYRKYSKKVIDYQIESGLTYVNDGYLRRQDLLRPFTENLGGVEVGQLYRWFNNNTFYRIPVVKGKLSGDAPFNKSYPDLLPKENLKAVLPAPYTFTKLSKNEYYGDEKEFLIDYAEILNKEIKSLEAKGYSYIQLSDPALVYHNTAPCSCTLSDIAEAIEVATKGVKARTGLVTFFGDAAPVLGAITDWAVDDIGVDYYETDSDVIKEHRFKDGLSLGLVDARNTLKEDVSELVGLAQEVIDSSSPKNINISTNCDLDFLTWKEAKEKINTVCAVATQLKEAI